MSERPSIESAIAMASHAHRGQRYPSPEREPYVFHPLRLMLTFNDEVSQIVAIFHDAIEDTGLELQDLVDAGFAQEIVVAVDALTHRCGETYEEYIERVAANDIACRVKIADLRDNLRNNLRLPSSAEGTERVARYQLALARLLTVLGQDT